MSSLMKLAFWFVAANALAGACSLIFFPGDTARLFFWEITPSINAALFGALYLGGAATVALVTYRGRWEPARFLIPILVSAGALISVTTLLHLDLFSPGPRLVYWLVIYVGAPLLALLFYVQHERSGADWRVTRPVTPATRALAITIGASLVLLGIVVLIRPEPVVAQWPWPTTPLMVRIFASWFSAFGVGLLWFLVERDWDRLRHVADLMIAAAGLDLLMVFVHRQDLTSVGPSLWLYCSHLALFGLVGLLMHWLQRKAGPRSSTASYRISARGRNNGLPGSGSETRTTGKGASGTGKPVTAAVFQPCDAGVIQGTRASALCRPSSRAWVIAAASLGSGMAFLDSTVLNVALPAVQTDLGASAHDVQWIYGAFALVLSALLLVGGTLGDRYGRRRAFVLGAALFAAASVWCALAPGPGHLVAARAVQGAGGALLVPASLAIVGASFEGKLRAKAIGAWGALSGTAMAVGPVLGGWLVEEVSWRAALLIVPALAVVAIPIALWHVPESRDPKDHRLDLVGAVLATTGLAGLVYALIESSASGFGDPAVLAALILGAAALLAFVAVERRSKDPMVPPSLFRSRGFGGANLVTLLFYMALTGSLYFVPFLMMQVHGYSAFVAGSVFLPFVAMTFLLGRLSGRICARFGAKVPLVVASLATVVGFVLFALPGVEHGSYWTSFFPAMVVQGFGMALVITPLTTVALGSVEDERSGLASGVNNAVARVAGLLAVAVLGMVVYGTFSANLDARLEGMDMPGGVRSELEAAKANLGAAEAPEGLDAGTAARIERAIDESFVAGFRVVMLVSVGLALASALAAALLVGDRGVQPASRNPIRRMGAGARVPVLHTASREGGAAREGRAPRPVTVNPT